VFEDDTNPPAPRGSFFRQPGEKDKKEPYQRPDPGRVTVLCARCDFRSDELPVEQARRAYADHRRAHEAEERRARIIEAMRMRDAEASWSEIADTLGWASGDLARTAVHRALHGR
jgi:hypothetical protein